MESLLYRKENIRGCEGRQASWHACPSSCPRGDIWHVLSKTYIDCDSTLGKHSQRPYDVDPQENCWASLADWQEAWK